MNIIHTSTEKRHLLFFFLFSFLAGCLITNVLFQNLFQTAFIEFKTDTGLILTIGNKKLSLMFYYFILHARVFFLLVFFSYTNVYALYSRIFLCYTGFIQGILLSFCIHKSHFLKGVLEYVCFLFPHTLILAPFYLFSLLFFQKSNENLFCSNTKQQKRKLILKQFPFYLFSLCLIFAASFLEAYLNLPLLKKVLKP